jgi:hypothetical protein
MSDLTELIAKAEAVALRPGDTLVVGFNDPLTPEEAARLRERFREALRGKNNNVIFVDDTASVRVQPTEERPEHRACRRQS